MKWTSAQNGFLLAELDEGSTWPRESELAECAQTLVRQIGRFQAADSWNAVKVEIWSDSGRFIAFPCMDGSPERTDSCGVQMVIPDLMAPFDDPRFDEEDNASDRQFDAVVSELERRLAADIIETWPPQMEGVPFGIFSFDEADPIVRFPDAGASA
jgi:hypothetical protein